MRQQTIHFTFAHGAMMTLDDNRKPTTTQRTCNFVAREASISAALLEGKLPAEMQNPLCGSLDACTDDVSFFCGGEAWLVLLQTQTTLAALQWVRVATWPKISSQVGTDNC